MAIALVASTSAGSADSLSNFTTLGITTTGATLLVAAVSEYEGSITGGSTVSDSKANTWTPLTLWVEGGASSEQVRLFYTVPDAAHVGAAHTFTCVSAGLAYSVLTVAAFSGTHASAPFDQQNGAEAVAITIQAGSVTPSQPGELILAALAHEGTVTAIDSGLTILETVAVAGGAHIGGALAWVVQGTAGAINPTWTLASATSVSAAIATFKAQPIAFVASVSAGSADTVSNFTTAGITTTGATLLVAAVGEYEASITGGSTVSDSKGNTWLPLTLWVEGGATADQVRLFYAVPDGAHVGAAHTFTCISAGLAYTVLTVAAFSGTHASAPFDQQNGTDAVTNTPQAGTVTPSEHGELIIAALATESSTINAIDSGLTMTQNLPSTGNHIAGAMAWIVQPTAAAINPAWTVSGTNPTAAAIATFKRAAGAAPPAVVDTGDLMLLGVGG